MQLTREIPNSSHMKDAHHLYEVRPRKDKRGVDLISDVLPFGRLWYTKQDDAVEYAKFFSRSHDAVVRVYDEAGKVIETHEHARRVQRVVMFLVSSRRTFGLKGIAMIYLVRQHSLWTAL